MDLSTFESDLAAFLESRVETARVAAIARPGDEVAFIDACHAYDKLEGAVLRCVARFRPRRAAVN